MADSNSIVGSIGLDASAIVSALQQTVAQVNAAGAASTKLNVTINNVTKTTAANAVATMQQVNALKVQTAQANAATAQSKAHAAAIKAQTAALQNFSAVARSSRGPATNVSPAFTASGGGNANFRNFQAGNAAMQVQDIAVSLQGGMSGLQVMGQQGSQLLSILGPKGMLVGGVIAVGAALGTAIYGGKKAFEELNKAAAETNAELDQIAKFGTGGELSAGLTRASEQLKTIQTAREGQSGFFSKGFANLSRFVGGDTAFERGVKLNEREMELALARKDIVAAIIAERQRENEILQTQANGASELADAEKRRLDYDREIAAINGNPNLQDDEKTILKEIALSDLSAKNKIADNEIIAKRKKEIAQDEERQLKDKFEWDKMIWEMQDSAMREFYEDQIKEEENLKKYQRDRLKSQQEEYRDFIAAVNKSEAERIEKEKQKAERNKEDADTQRDRLAILETEITKGDKAANLLREKLRLEKEIEDARKNQNKKLENGLLKEKQLLETKQAIEEQLKSPEQKKAERDQARAERKAARIVASRARRLAQAAANAGFGGVAGGDKANGVPNLNPNAPAAGAAGAAAGNQMKVDTLVVKVLKHG